MKKILTLLFVAIVACSGSAMAQKTIKLGHINSNELMQIMPGRDSAQAVLQKEMEDLESTLKSMSSELETRYNDYLAKQDAMSDLIKQTKQRELQDMQARMMDGSLTMDEVCSAVSSLGSGEDEAPMAGSAFPAPKKTEDDLTEK